ncbi:MAG: 6-phosphogluconolactonase [Paracoccaceae bacterium]|jgi:6-phosphogluconolactonase
MERIYEVCKDVSFSVAKDRVSALIIGMKKMILAAAALVGVTHAESTTVYVGTGADGIYTLELNEKTGALTNRQHVVKGQGMGFQEVNKAGDVIFSTYNSGGKGAVSAYSVDDGKFTEISVQTYDGRGLCHVSIDAKEKVLFGADYGGGKVVSFPLNGGEIGELASLMQHEGSSVNEQRQEKPHAHSIFAGPDNKFAYAPDLGIDQVKFYAFGEKGKLEDQGGFKAIPGSGPRHMKFGKDGSHAYVLNELTCSVTAFLRDTESGKLTARKTESVFSVGADGSKMSCSEIRVSGDGKFIYTANRDLTKAGRDSISVFAVAEDGSLKLVETAPAAVWIPRNINLSPSGDWLLVAGQNSNEVSSHRIDKKTGKLTYSGERAEVPKAMCINFDR